MASDDPAALAASTAQGWAYALNSVARPAPEHLEAAQEALTALERADRHAPALGAQARWLGVRNTLSEALTAARLRVDGGRPEITVAQLTEAVGQLRELGLVPGPAGPTVPEFVVNAALARGDQQRAELETRLAELEDQLEIETGELRAELNEANAIARRQTELRDRFERERDQLQRELKAAHGSREAAVAGAREDSRRAGYVWCLAQLGNSLPGYDDMSTEELRQLATKRLQEAHLDGGTLRHVANELVRAERLLSANYEGAPYLRPSQDEPLELASVVTLLASWTQRARQAAVERQAELEAVMEAAGWEDPDQLPQLRAAREERDMLTRARDAQAAELRTLREELAAADRARSELQEKLAELRRTAAEGAVRQEAGRRRIAELEATLKVERGDDITDPESP